MTMLGIIIAVMAVIVIVAISEGVRQQIGNQVNRYGRDVLTIRPFQETDIANSALPATASTLLTEADQDTVQKTTGIEVAVPVGVVPGVVRGDQTVSDPLVVATTPALGEILNQEIEYGGFFNTADGERAAVLGSEIATELFDDNAPLGRTVNFRGHDFIVAGVFEPFLAAPFSLEANFNHAVFVPSEAIRTILGSVPQSQEILAKVASGSDPEVVAAEVRKNLTASHGGTADAVVLTSSTKSTQTAPVLNLLTRMTIGTAVVALLVGGVGIMNMMLLSVTERIHEIGLRKAVGATNSQVLRQFVTEAIALCGIGAMIGLFAALSAIGLLRLFTSLQPVIVWPVALAVPLIALGAGVLFGSIPAIKASRMDPIEALRHE